MKPVSARLPVSAISRSSPTRSSISAHSAPVRWSFQRIAGRRTRSSASSTTSPCICPERPTGPSGQPREHRLRGAPPVLGILLGPARVRRRERIRLLGDGEHRAVLVDRDPLDAGRADVEADQRGHAPRAAYTSSYARTASFACCALRSSAVVDLRRDAVDEPPLEHRPLHGADRVLGVRVEVEPEPLAVLAVAGAPQLDRELERLHERGRADHVVVVERAPAGVRVLVAEQPFRREQRRVLGEVLAVHDQVLPVHVDLHVVDPLRAQRVDHVQRHADVPHEDLHRGLGVLVLEEERDAALGAPARDLADAVDEARPRVGVRRLERVVVALDSRPEDHLRAELARERGHVERLGERRAPHRVVGGGEAALAVAGVQVRSGRDGVDPVPVERLAHRVEVVARVSSCG